MHALQALAVLLCMFCILVSKNESTSLFILPSSKAKPKWFLTFLFFFRSVINVDARPIVQRVYKNIITVHASQILHWSLENLPKTQAGCRLQIHSASSSTISNTLVSTCGLQVTSKTMELWSPTRVTTIQDILFPVHLLIPVWCF